MKAMKKAGKKKIALALTLLLLAVFSFFVVADYASSPEVHKNSIEKLDEKQETVMALAAGSTAASVGITLLPGDAATPIAEKLSDIATYLLWILCAILLEKYLVTITGYAAFKLLIPAALAGFALSLFWDNSSVKKLASKLLIFGTAIFLIIPVSVKVSSMIESTYEESIQMALETAKEAEEEARAAEAAEEDKIESESGTEKRHSGFWNKVTDSVSDMKESVANTASSLTTNVAEKAKESVNQFLEATAVMLVTSCVIPIIVMLFFFWLVKTILEADIQILFTGDRLREKRKDRGDGL